MAECIEDMYAEFGLLPGMLVRATRELMSGPFHCCGTGTLLSVLGASSNALYPIAVALHEDNHWRFAGLVSDFVLSPDHQEHNDLCISRFQYQNDSSASSE